MFFFLSFLTTSAPLLSLSEERSFLSWMRKNNRYFTGDEYHLRLGIWLSNKQYVISHNKKDSTFKLSMNSLSHLTPTEYRSLLSTRRSPHQKSSQKPKIPKLPNFNDVLDLRDFGMVNPVRNCGSCSADWAFAAVAQFECKNFKQSSVLYELSESFLIDCVPDCSGCDSGDYTAAVKYILHQYNGGMMTRSDYPYTPLQKECQLDQTKLVGEIRLHTFIDEDQEDDIFLTYFVGYWKTVASCSLDADHASFQLYHSGIYDEPNCDRTYLNHAVNCVGYGVQDDILYFIVRNCWGASWGEEGYIRMIRGTNQCGLSNKVDLFDN